MSSSSGVPGKGADIAGEPSQFHGHLSVMCRSHESKSEESTGVFQLVVQKIHACTEFSIQNSPKVYACANPVAFFGQPTGKSLYLCGNSLVRIHIHFSSPNMSIPLQPLLVMRMPVHLSAV